VRDLRQHGIKTAYDLTQVTPEEIQKLFPETTLTESALKNAKKSFEDGREIERLRDAAGLLGQFWQREGKSASPSTKEVNDSYKKDPDAAGE